MKPRLKRWVLSVAAASAAAACADRLPTEPDLAVAARSSLSTTSSDDVVRLLKRTDGLSGSHTASGIIGPRGGRLKLEKAGLRVEFPRGAVKTPTLITITAIRGRNVAYKFEPHGITFDKPVTLKQSLRNTTAWKNAEFAAELQGAYFERLMVDRTESYARTREHRGGKLQDAGRMLEFSIEHFSGYMVSTGKVPVDVDIGIDITSR